MIISFYDRQFNGLQNNASLVIDNSSYSLVKRGIEFDSLSCKCEAFTENIQPTFLVVKNDKGNYIYACLAGIPQLNADNQTEITGSDLKTMFKSDVIVNSAKSFGSVNSYFQYVFENWNSQVNQKSFKCELVFDDEELILFDDKLLPSGDGETAVNAWEDVFAPYLKYYGLYMTGKVDLVAKKVIFIVGKSMEYPLNIKLWEHGVKNYGKWVADVNETQGYVLNTVTGKLIAKVENGSEVKWILTSQNAISTNVADRDIFPVKRKVIIKETDDESKIETLLAEAAKEALLTLTNSMFNENIELENVQADFKTQFNIYVKRGEKLYKSLPCGELHYDCAGLKKVQIGYRFTGIQFLF